MRIHQMFKGMRIQSTAPLATEEKTYPARTKFCVEEVTQAHTSERIPATQPAKGMHRFLAYAKIKAIKRTTLDPFKDKKLKGALPLLICESKENEDLPFTVIST